MATAPSTGVSGTSEPSSHTHVEGLRLRLSPNNAQQGALLSSAGAARFTWNWAVAQIKANQRIYDAQTLENLPKEARTRPLSFLDLQKRWYVQRDQVAKWHEEYSSKIFLYSLRNAARAHQDWLKGDKGFPRFKARHFTRPSFTTSGSVYLESQHVVVPRLGAVRITAPCKAQATWRRRIRRGRGRIVSVTISQDPSGRWWASLTLERQCSFDHAQRDAPTKAIGVDVGVRNLVVAATPTGEEVLTVPGASKLRTLERKVRKAQRAVSRKDLAYAQTTPSYLKAIAEGRTPKIRRSPSRRREAARLNLARLHAQAKDARTTLLHQTTHALVAEAGRRNAVLVVEDLNVAGMSRRGGAHKKGLNRALRDAALGELGRQLAYKTQKLLGEGRLLTADRWFPSSKTCAQCGTVKTKLSLSERTYRCDNPACGHTTDRDLNAAHNLAAWGEEKLTQAGDRDSHGPLEGNTFTPTEEETNPHSPEEHSSHGDTRQLVSVGASQTPPGVETLGTPPPHQTHDPTEDVWVSDGEGAGKAPAGLRGLSPRNPV